MQQMIWFTPEGIEDLLPSQAQKLEYYRRKTIDSFEQAGYGLVLTPLAEFTDSLLTGTGKNQATDICRFTDQESGKMMGVRADVTPQVARIVSNRIKPSTDQLPVRLCYVAEVLKTRNNKAKGSRSPIQAGVELFGIDAVEADIEVIELMLDVLFDSGISALTLSIGHVAIVNQLMELAELDEASQSELVDILQRKAVPEYEQFLESMNLNEPLKSAFEQLLTLNGKPEEVLKNARGVLQGLTPALDSCLQRLSRIVEHFSQVKNCRIVLDLAELRGYAYHTGIVFGCYASSHPLYLLAKGGRYDGVGKQFGQNLPATGFSMDLRGALDILPDIDERGQSHLVYAPCSSDCALKEKVLQLKSEGKTVLKSFDPSLLSPGDQMLSFVEGEWVVEIVKES